MPDVLPLAFQAAVRAHGNNPALVTKVNGQWKGRTYAEWAECSRALACALLELGVAKGDRVGLLSENRPEWLIADQGILSSGAASVPVYPTLTAEQSAYILNDSGAAILLLSSAKQLEKIRSVQHELTTLKHVVVFDAFEPAPGPLSVIGLAEFMALGEQCDGKHGAELDARVAALTGGDLASIVYTSGTTGDPKGAMLTHGNFTSNAEAVGPLINVQASDSCLSFLPLSHVFERIASYFIVNSGATIYFAESVEAVPANLLEVKPTFLVAVPRLYEKIKARVFDAMASAPPVRQKLFHWALEVGYAYQAANEAGEPIGFGLALKHTLADRLVFSKIRERTGGRLKLCVSGGAPLPADVGRFFGAIGIPILEGYGLTETSPVISLNRIGKLRFGTVGYALPGVTVKLGSDGELLAKGPNVMKGYWKKPEATAEAIDAEGFFHTGDIAEIDPEGLIKIVDRKKEILVMSNGKNIAPQPIEAALRGSRYIEQAMVVGDRRNYVTALLVPDFATLTLWAEENGLGGLDRQALLAHPKALALFDAEVKAVNADLAHFETVKKFALLPREFEQARDELSAKLSLKRRVILTNNAEAVESLYATAATA